jgi:RNA polymerase sigma-70 factor, ECF subfamily
MEGCRQGNRRSQEQLYRFCHAPMLRVCRLYVAQPQEAAALYNAAMLKVFNAMGQYAGKGEWMAWVRRIVVNTCLDHCRQQARFISQPMEAVAEEELAIDPEAINRFSVAETVQLLQEIPKASAMVFNLFAIEGYAHREIAELLGISPGTSKWHLNEARRLLKARLERIDQQKLYSHAG